MYLPFDEFLSQGNIHLRTYQEEVAHAVVRAVRARMVRKQNPGQPELPVPGRIAVMFPRQSGKNELQAILGAFLLIFHQHEPGAELVQVSPTWRPQSLNAMRRLERILDNHILARNRWTKESGFVYRLGEARLTFLSGEPSANIVGHTANVILMLDEAQDILVTRFDKDIAPMAASANALIVFWGTAWSRHTLLARELDIALAAQVSDGIPRAFVRTADDVGREVPAYAAFVASQVRSLGRDHPMIRSQYLSEAIDEGLGMFSPAQRAMLQGDHAPESAPRPKGRYALSIDVGGADFGAFSGFTVARLEETDGLAGSPAASSSHNPTAITIVHVDTSQIGQPGVRKPTYRVVQRLAWTGWPLPKIYAAIQDLHRQWDFRKIVIDATGLGVGLASLLAEWVRHTVRPFIFTLQSKSELGYRFISMIEEGRIKDFRLPAESSPPANPPAADPSDPAGTATAGTATAAATASAPADPAIPATAAAASDEPLLHPAFLAEQARLQAAFQAQALYCKADLIESISRTIRWSVPRGLRNPATGELVHDDLLISLAMIAHLDDEVWNPGISGLTGPEDPFLYDRQRMRHNPSYPFR